MLVDVGVTKDDEVVVGVVVGVVDGVVDGVVVEVLLT